MARQSGWHVGDRGIVARVERIGEAITRVLNGPDTPERPCGVHRMNAERVVEFRPGGRRKFRTLAMRCGPDWSNRIGFRALPTQPSAVDPHPSVCQGSRHGIQADTTDSTGFAS